MAKQLHEYTWAGLVDLIERASEELYRRGYEQGKSDANKVEAKRRPIVGISLPQAVRDSIVEQAKADITELIPDELHFEGKYYRVNHVLGNKVCEADFVVNKGKRTVVAIMRGCISGKVYARGIAKCAPDDCFNVHLGRAIALRRALGLEVPSEYLNAPQPTEVRVGDIVKYPNGRIVEILEKDFFDVNRVKEVSTGDISSATTFELTKIIDDSREGVTQ